MKFAVTGGAGFIGGHLSKFLLKEGHDIIVIDNIQTKKKDNLSSILDKIKFFSEDIRNYEKIRNILKNVDGVFHEAALTIVQESFTKQKEYHDVNVVGTENILKIVSEFGLKLVYASSSSVYGNSKKIPIKETYSRKPINPYGETKLQDELLAEKYSKNDTQVIGLRYFNVYGKGQTGSYAGVITKFLDRIKNGKSPEIFGDGEQIRDFIHVEDVARANLVAMNSKCKSGFFNIGTGIPTSINQLAEIMINLSGKNLELNHVKPVKGDVKMSLAGTQYSKKMLAWKYKIGLNEGLQKIFKD